MNALKSQTLKEVSEPRLLWFLRNVLGWLKWPNCSKNLAPPPRLPPKAGSFNVLFRESRRLGVVPARWLCSKDSLVAKGSLAMTLFVLFNSCLTKKNKVSRSRYLETGQSEDGLGIQKVSICDDKKSIV